MKKKSRFLTGLLSAVMALSLFALPAAAADTGKVLTTPDFSEGKTGSITINKYEYNKTKDTDKRDDGENGTPIPEGTTKLNGVEFTIYKVESADWLKQYYQSTGTDKDGNALAAPTVGKYVTDGKINSKYENTKVASKKTGEAGEGETAVPGQVKFSGLELGLYVVIETNKPDSVTKATDPFLVSIPMTSVDKTSWLYDVIVNPKNKTEYAGITLKKFGRTGDTVDNTQMVGYEFVLEKYSTNGWVKIEKAPANGVDNAGDELVLTTDEDGKITIASLSAGVYRFTEKTVTKKNGYIVDGKTHYIFKVEGQHIVEITDDTEKAKYSEEGDNNVFSVKDATSVDQVNAYNERPDVEKKVEDRKGKPDEKADYSIGDRVPYTVTIDIPKNITDLKNFEVVDKPTNLTDDVKSVKIYEAGNNEPLTDTFYTVTATDGGFKIVFNTKEMAAYAGKKLIAKYEAVLTKDAVDTTAGNQNTITLTYSNQVFPSSEPNKEPTENTIEDVAVVYTFSISIKKTAEDKKTPLPNVKFDLYKQVDEKKLTEEDAKAKISPEAAAELGLPNADGSNVWVKVAKLITDPNGEVSYKGLANGTYYLVETETAEGYNLLSAPVKVELNISAKTTWKQVDHYDDQGNLVKHNVDYKETTFEGSNETSTGYVLTTIINRKGLNLPVTGGFGTLLFSCIGALLVVGGVGVLMSTKKKKKGNV